MSAPCSGYLLGAVFCRHGFAQSAYHCGAVPRYSPDATLTPECCSDEPPRHADASGKPGAAFLTIAAVTP